MKIYIMTDLEGVCGVTNFQDWTHPGKPYYEEGRRLLALEVNAAIDGFFAAGATDILVVDGHGPGGVNHLLLDQRVQFLRGPTPGPYPFMLDETFDAMAWVGQHAKAGTEKAQMAHTGNFNVIDYKINGISVGEFAQIALCGAHFGVRSIFGSGDEAFTKEAADFIPGIETVSVKKGIMPGSGDDCDKESYIVRNNGAIHIHPEQARKLIREGAERALRRFAENKEQFRLPNIDPPYTKEITYRSDGSKQPYSVTYEHPSSIIALLNGK